MPDSCIYIGALGTDVPYENAALGALGITPIRLQHGDGIQSLLADPPVAVVVDARMSDLEEFMASIRERADISPVPVVARVADLHEDNLERAFAAGIDDYLPDGEVQQFDALLAAVHAADPWKAARAPAGKVLLAHADRLERIRHGAVLRRNGFDPYFVADATEMASALDKSLPRAAVATIELGMSASSGLMSARSGNGDPLPLVLIASRDSVEEARRMVAGRLGARILDTEADAESLTFLINELLAPAPPNVRRTPRLLYHVPLRFRPMGQDGPWLFGYSFNANLNGMFIRTLAPLPMQARIEVAFRPPRGRGEVVLFGQVMWRKEFADSRGAATPPGMGIQFIESYVADSAGYEAGYCQLLEESGEGLIPMPVPPTNDQGRQ